MPVGIRSGLHHRFGQPLGLTDSPRIDQSQVELEPGSLLLLYTDGVTETANDSGELFGTDRVLGVLEEAGADASAEEVCQSLHAALRTYRGAVGQADDVTAMAIKANP